jgi:hypothetical protein
MARTPTCPSCRGSLEEGFIPDNTHGSWLQASWHAGPPQQWKFFGIPAGTKVDRKEMIPIEAWRCSSCGLISLVAPGR